MARLIETGLKEALDYDVPTFLRGSREIVSLAAATPFPERQGPADGKLQVALLAKKPTAAQCEKALAFATAKDQLAIGDQELYWLPEGKLTESNLEWSGIEKALGTMTVRTQRTIQRLALKMSAK